ncbi:MAG: thioredoxin fold domain-containing protein [bacterium]
MKNKMPLFLKSMAFFTTFFIISFSVISQAAEVQDTQNLYATSLKAKNNSEVIILMLALTDCTHCARLRNEIFKPWALSDDYKNQAIFVETLIDADKTIKDFDGKTINAAKFGKKYHAVVAPVVVFLNSQGKELSNAIIGANSIDMYGFYFDNAIKEAINKNKQL